MSQIILAPETQNFDARFNGTTCTLRIYCSEQFYSAEGEQVTGAQVNGQYFYQEYDCPITGGLIEIPEVTLPSTTDGFPSNATYTAVFYDESGAKQNVKLSNFFLDPELLTANDDSVIESSVTVTAAGTLAAQGNYLYTGQLNSKPYYVLEGQASLLTFIISAAGDSDANGTYTVRGTYNGKPYYNLVGYPDSTTEYAVVWADEITPGTFQWQITTGGSLPARILYYSAEDMDFPYQIVDTDWTVYSAFPPTGLPQLDLVTNPPYTITWTGSQWRINSSTGTRYYYSTEDVANPWDIVTWVADVGSNPLPAVTQAATIIGTTWEAVFLTNNTPCVPWGLTIDQIYIWITNYLQSVVIPWASTSVGGKIYTSKTPLLSYHPIAVESSEYMWQAVDDNRSLKEWNGDLVQAIADIGATPTTLWITEANQYTASGSLLTGGTLTVGETYEIATYTGAVSRGGSFLPVTIVEQGSGYSLGSGIATTGGTGTGLTVQITFVDGDGLVYGVLPTNAGTGYTVGDIVSINGAPAILKNAGSAINGTYTQRGTSNGKPYYNLVGYANSTANRAIVWTGSIWKITNNAGTTLYSSAEAEDYPWQIISSDWTVVSGTSPVPEITDNPCKFKVTSVVGADFSNVGADFFDVDDNLCPGNAKGTIFTATGTTPTSWTGASLRPYVTVPSNIKLMFTGEGSIKATTGLGIYVNGMQDPGNVQIFNTDGTSKIIVNPACVPEVNMAWWAETPSDVDDTHEFVQVRDSLAKDKVGGIANIPAGTWYTDEIVWTSQSTIKGAGGHFDGINVGTCICPADNNAKYVGIFSVQQQFVNIAFRDMTLVASGYNFCNADTGSVMAFNYTAEGSSSLGLRFTNVNFFSNYQGAETQQTEIYNAGTVAANGFYTVRGSTNGKFYYNLLGQVDSTSNYCIKWTTGYQWIITSGAGATLYYSDDNTIYPWEVTTWVVSTGASPVPEAANPLGPTQPLTRFDGGSQWYEMIDLYFDYCSWTTGSNANGVNSAIYWRSTNSGGQFNTPLFRVGQNSTVFKSPACGFITIIDPDCRGNAGYTVSEVPNRTIAGATITIGTNILTIPTDYITPGAMFTTADIGQYVVIPGVLPDAASPNPKYYITRLNTSFEAVLNADAVGTAGGDDLEIQYLGNWTGGVAECIYDLSTNISFNVFGGADEGFQYFTKLRGSQYFEALNLYGVLLQSIVQGTPYSGVANFYGCTFYSNGIDGLGGAWGVRMMGGTIRRKLIRHDATRFPYPDTMEVSPGNAWHLAGDFIFDTSFKESSPLSYSDGEELNFLVNAPARFLDANTFGGPAADVPQVVIMSPLVTGDTKILLRLGQSFPYAGTGRYYYDLARDGITGHLLITGNQAYPYNGVDINGSLMADQSITLNSDDANYSYGYSHGGTVVQATNKTTAVTINAKCGFIEVNSTGTIAANDSVRFKVNNSAVQVWDMPQIIVQHNTGGGIIAVAEDIADGEFYIRLVNYTTVAETTGYILRFTLTMRSNPFS